MLIRRLIYSLRNYGYVGELFRESEGDKLFRNIVRLKKQLASQIEHAEAVIQTAQERSAADGEGGNVVVDYITGVSEGELARSKAEAAYTSAALGREIDLHRETAAELERVRSAIRDLRSECFSGPAVDKDAVWAACLKLFAAALTPEEVSP